MTREQARAELLILAAAMLAGATAGVLVQAGVEVGRYRRNSRGQLRAAGAVLDERDEQLRQVLDVNERQADAIEQLRDELRELQQRVVADCDGCGALAASDNDGRELETRATPERTTSPEVASWPPSPPCDECGTAAPEHEPGCFLDGRGGD